MRLVSAVRKALRGLDLSDTDKAAAELALAYATAIDAGHCSECEADTTLDTLGPKLQAALETLGATPRARAALVKGGASERATKSPLDELRRKRAARVDNAEAVDTTAAGTEP